jgi:hypothetical protein
MSTSEERLQILRMVQEGKITAEEGMHLLEALGSSAPARKEPPAPFTPAGPIPPIVPSSFPETPSLRTPRWFRVRVTDTSTGKVRVNVRLPINVVNAGVKMGARFSTEVEGLNIGDLSALINSGTIGQIVDVLDEEDGEHVEVFLE